MSTPIRLRYASEIVGAFLLMMLLVIVVTSFGLIRANNYFSRPERFFLTRAS